jgi:hypothetical protein
MNGYHEQIELLGDNPELLTEVERVLPPPEKQPNGEPTAGTGERVDGAALVRELESFIGGFVILPPGTLLPVALWAAATHTYQSFDTFPYLALLSPTKQCGKTRLIEALGLVVRNARPAVNISEAALFRVIEAASPTLMLDEAEALAGKTDRAQAIRALLNAGNRKGVTVLRCVGKNFEVKEFHVYCPKVVAGIGACPETIRDRSIVLNMQRKRPSDEVGRFLSRTVEPAGKVLHAKLAGWVAEHKSDCEQLYSRMDGLPYLGDRDAEGWEPIFVLLAVADPERLAELKDSAIRLSANKAAADEDDSLGLRLLTDIRAVWRAGEPTMPTADLLSRLAEIEEAPWGREVPLSPRRLARMLRPFGAGPAKLHGVKGYRLDALQPAFLRYLAAEGPQGPPTA